METARESPSAVRPTMGPRAVTSTGSRCGGCPLTLIVSSMILQGAKPDASRTLSPSSPICSKNRSELSASPKVTPQATCPLWPMGKAGSPLNVAPTRPHVGARTCARYQCGGSPGARWGSLARMGRPVAVFEGERAQPLEAGSMPTKPVSAARSRASASIAGPALRPGDTLTGCHSGYGLSRSARASGPSCCNMRKRTSSMSQLADSAMAWSR